MSDFNKVLVAYARFTFAFLYFASFHVEGDTQGLKFFQQKEYHLVKEFSDGELRSLARLNDNTRFKDILSNILVPRVVGTEGHEKVKNYITQFLQSQNIPVELNEFSQYIPSQRKNLTFSNIIGRLNDNASRYVVLSCHYDSKFMGAKEFLAATDSAVPCAIMLDIVAALGKDLSPYRSTDVSLMLIFFDGEEAFHKWSATDSLYGSRHLAKTWERTSFARDGANHLQRMDVMVLLDLLGAPNPTFYYHNEDTKHLHYIICDIQNRLSKLGELENYSSRKKYFLKRRSYSNIEDDHLPFLLAVTPVPILHVIPEPFPDVWHTLADNYDALDFPTIYNLNKVFRIFTMSYLQGTFDDTRFLRNNLASRQNRDHLKSEL